MNGNRVQERHLDRVHMALWFEWAAGRLVGFIAGPCRRDPKAEEQGAKQLNLLLELRKVDLLAGRH